MQDRREFFRSLVAGGAAVRERTTAATLDRVGATYLSWDGWLAELARGLPHNHMILVGVQECRDRIAGKE